jgi:hypothetical protein
MSHWSRLHLNESIRTLATHDTHRFFIQLKEPPGEERNPIEFYRWTLEEAKDAGDRLVQAYYPHDCDDSTCGVWRKIDE